MKNLQCKQFSSRVFYRSARSNRKFASSFSCVGYRSNLSLKLLAGIIMPLNSNYEASNKLLNKTEEVQRKKQADCKSDAHNEKIPLDLHLMIPS